jgi:hypothetical protein
MRFVLPTKNQLALSVAAAHGAADAGRHPAQLLIYGIALLPWSNRATTAAFAASSVVHFAQDLGTGGSLLLHATAAGLALHSVEKAVRLVLTYMIAVHIPCLAFALARKGRTASAACMVCAMLLFARLKVPRIKNGCFLFTHRQQLLIVAHVLIQMLFPL